MFKVKTVIEPKNKNKIFKVCQKKSPDLRNACLDSTAATAPAAAGAAAPGDEPQ